MAVIGVALVEIGSRQAVERGDHHLRLEVEAGDVGEQRLGWPAERLLITFQSRFGRAEWLQPYTDVTLTELAKKGVRRIAVITPGFSADCLETLEEIAIRGKETFVEAGGTDFAALPCLNDRPEGMRVIEHVVRRELMGWV